MTDDIYPNDLFAKQSLKDPKTGQYKTIGQVPGIGPACEAEFHKIGFFSASHLVGKFLSLDMDEEMYTQWFIDTVNIDNAVTYATASYAGLKSWADLNL